MNNNYCVIMAGGIGSRFWPISRKSLPKQFLDILGTGKTFIQSTYERFLKIVPPGNFYVVTSVDYKDLVLSQLPDLKENQVLLEPLRRNTAPCIAYAANKIRTVNPEARLIVAPSDHLILKEEEFIRQIQNGLDFVSEKNVLLTLGIKPNRPEVNYGYIQIAEKIDQNDLDNLFKVKTFTEKPIKEVAEMFVRSGEFFWNSGIFIWSLSSILAALEKHLPAVSHLFAGGLNQYNTSDEIPFINKIYSVCQGVSIDYGVMEKADNVYVLTADFGWSDLGTWGSLYENKTRDEAGNVISGNNILTYETRNCIIDLPEGKIAVLQGLEGLIVVESNNTLLICRMEDEHQIRQFVSDVRQQKGESFV
jgi:mannose-1-phosphate guanylyltransferase